MKKGRYEILTSWKRFKELLSGDVPAVVITCNSKPHPHGNKCLNTDFGSLDELAFKAPTFHFGVLDLVDVLPEEVVGSRIGYVMIPQTFIYHPKVGLEFHVFLFLNFEKFLPWLEGQVSKGVSDRNSFIELATSKLVEAGVLLEHDELTVGFSSFIMRLEKLMERDERVVTKPATWKGPRSNKPGPGRPKIEDQVPRMMEEMKAILKKGPQTYAALRSMIKGATTDKHAAFKELRDAGIIEKVGNEWHLKKIHD